MIRKYNEKEIPTLVNIWEQASAIAHPFLDSEFTKMVKIAMEKEYLPESDTWVYEETGEIVGFISMIKNEIGGLFVNPHYHSKGIGSLLVNHIFQFHMELEVEVFKENKIGKPFYEKYGFKVFKEYIQEPTNQKVLRLRKKRKLEFISKATIEINTSVSKVWNALVTPEIAKGYFFGAEIVSDWKENSSITFKGEYNGNEYLEKGVLIRVKPNIQLQYTHWSNLEGIPDMPQNYRLWTFDLIEGIDITKLSVSEDNIPTKKKLQRSDEFWGGVLSKIKQIVEK